MKAIIYTRVSHTTGSTSRQVSELREVEGYEVKKIFRESISGYTRSIEERPELNDALKYAEENRLVVYHVCFTRLPTNKRIPWSMRPCWHKGFDKKQRKNGKFNPRAISVKNSSPDSKVG